MEKDVSEKTVSEEKDTIKIATIAAVAKAIKDSAEYRQFSYYGEEDYAQIIPPSASADIIFLL